MEGAVAVRASSVGVWEAELQKAEDVEHRLLWGGWALQKQIRPEVLEGRTEQPGVVRQSATLTCPDSAGIC